MEGHETVTCCTSELKIAQIMKTLKMTFCIPCNEESDFQNVNPMNSPDATPRPNFAYKYDGMRQYC